MDAAGQRIISVEEAGLIPLGSDIYHRYGSETTYLQNPGDRQYQYLVLISEVGTWRVRLGDKTASMPGAADVSADVVDGTGAYKLGVGKEIVIPAPKTGVTVKGYAGTDALTYYWL